MSHETTDYSGKITAYATNHQVGTKTHFVLTCQNETLLAGTLLMNKMELLSLADPLPSCAGNPLFSQRPSSGGIF